MSTNTYLQHEQLLSALSLRDLTNSKHGIHAMQQLINETENAMTSLWSCYIQRLNPNPIVSIYDNYDALGYPKDGASRDVLYSRYLNKNLMLRTQTSSSVPTWLSSWQNHRPQTLALLSHGLVYRRDCIDRWHCAEPHQLDIWMVTPKNQVDEKPMLTETINNLLQVLLPNHIIQQSASPHPYTANGVQLDAIKGKELIEIGECGLIDPNLLDRNGWPSEQYTGIAMGLGLDRILMLRKGIPDIRLLRDPEPRVQHQMLNLSPWNSVSRQPKSERDISIVVDQNIDMDIIGDKIRTTLKEEVTWLEELRVLSKTDYGELPDSAIKRLGMKPTQVNLLLRIVLRHPSKSIPVTLANALRNKIYLALNEGNHHLAT
jgi:phenylalanyl-tRNA synthetase alpha chain